MDKENYPENSILYLNQGYLTIKDNKKIYYADYYLIGQINEGINPPADIENYVCKEREVKMYKPCYNAVLGRFQGLCETLGFIVVRGDPEKHFLDYDYDKQNSKILCLYHKGRIPSFFSGTFFNQHNFQFESGGLQTTYSNVHYFLLSATDGSVEINGHLGSVNLSPIDIPENSFETESNISFNPSKLDIDCQEKKIMFMAVVKMLKKNI